MGQEQANRQSFFLSPSIFPLGQAAVVSSAPHHPLQQAEFSGQSWDTCAPSPCHFSSALFPLPRTVPRHRCQSAICLLMGKEAGTILTLQSPTNCQFPMEMMQKRSVFVKMIVGETTGSVLSCVSLTCLSLGHYELLFAADCALLISDTK